ncbi:UDP-4-amino-4,6-dideoxy-N-acetyl-beta-L-altrosamine transaminase [Kingella negevensis]|nr:UDP-4-amino-4,6-dideoxy-N-acetyl-beta-L-altrosamine transaminase [Kingella negevensis]MDK4679997.1 UDP-4-amino-4,6-dideoxy-N-acetyl-beta-L-altrosamine transaminase [Kingella negevensis]MDK4682283.1 UDP-4-amino-4,6-dideoxy-N-acetyl-beta-L-altrosamine transaminase [Kingella negevensis]MDK4684851.1 UDP-4-amino-4,6-dideoxy-N-acetyl-beta-L-altrosamine transaminase [Kingella negevensis]MDK4688307.1 UDP-4-amino-4,6-dideoxy-N-acetyl-beta-L-altrosamine transaminase [Kingella negevensis]MDK4690480.1 
MKNPESKIMIPYGKQTISEADIAAVVSVLKSDYLTQGTQVPAFESSLKTHCGAQHAIAVCNATAALHIACLALGLGKGDILWTSPITFVASANCGLYCGASVDFVDIDPKTMNMSVDALAEKLAAAKISGSLPKIIVPVHLCGEPCDMQKIHALSKEYGFKIIEDASHAIGARYQNGYVGNCEYSDITVFSFHPVKIITTAEGGACLTNNAELANKIAQLRSHGITRNADEMVGESDGSWYYQQVDLGFNYRMTELQAALGVSQMTRLNEFVARRQELATRYDELLADSPVATPYRNPENMSALHLYPIRVLPESGKNRRQVFDYLREHGIGVNVHYIPVHTQPYYRELVGFQAGAFPHAETYYAQAISLPLYFGLTEAEQDVVVNTLKQAFQAA